MTDNIIIDNENCFAYGLPDNATDLERRKFVTQCMCVYKIEEYKNDDLTEYFSEVFLSLSANDFKLVTM